MIYSEITVGGSTGDIQDSFTKGDNLKDLFNFPVTSDCKTRVVQVRHSARGFS